MDFSQLYIKVCVILETIYLICRYGLSGAEKKIGIKAVNDAIIETDKIRAEGGYKDGNR